MADKPLKSIIFPGLPDKYMIPEIDSTLTQQGEAADAKAVGDEISGVKNTLTQLETEVGTVENSIAIIINGNTASVTVNTGQYVLVKNSTISGAPDGLYLYTGTNKSAGNTFVSGELSAVSSGGFNEMPYFTAANSATRINGNGSYTAQTNAFYRFNMVPGSGGVTVTINGLTVFYAAGGRYNAVLPIRAGCLIAAQVDNDAQCVISEYI